MGAWFDSEESFREAVAVLGLPLTSDEFRQLWTMVGILREEASRLRRYLDERHAGNPLAESASG